MLPAETEDVTFLCHGQNRHQDGWHMARHFDEPRYCTRCGQKVAAAHTSTGLCRWQSIARPLVIEEEPW